MKTIRSVNLLYFFAILFLGVFFGKQRALFDDSALQLYDMAATGLPRTEPSMLGAAVNFILPYLAIVLGMSVKAIVYAQALNYLLLPVLTFIFLRYRQQSVKYETAFLLAFSVFSSLTFYYPIHDYWPGFYALFILYRLVDDTKLEISESGRRAGEYLLIIFMMFTHLSIVISLGFLYLYLLLLRSVPIRKVLHVYAFMFIVLLFKIFMVHWSYHNAVIDPDSILSRDLGQYLDSVTLREFFLSLPGKNINFVLLFVFATGVGIYKKRPVPIILLGLIFFTSILVVVLLFGNYGYNAYTEGYVKSVNIVSGIILLDMIFSLGAREKLLSLLLAANYAFSVAVLWQGGLVFRHQYDFVKESVGKFSTNVYLRSGKDICALECLALPRQSMLINQIENGKRNCIFANVRHESYVEYLNQKWIEDNRKDPVRHFAFTGDPVYLDADSMGLPIERFFILFPDSRCDDLVRRLGQ